MTTKQRPRVGGREKWQERGREGEKKRGVGVRRDQDATMYCLYLFGPLLLKHRKKKRERKKEKSEGVCKETRMMSVFKTYN